MMRMHSMARPALAAGLLAAFSAGCGGASTASKSAPEAPAGSAPAPSEAAAPESGESELTRAERDLDDADARLSSSASEADASMEEGAGYQSAGPSPGAGMRCTTVCKAYASLLRARAAICRIDGELGPRCERANFTVERHENTRAACDCPKE
jgi:hypothetical protein